MKPTEENREPALPGPVSPQPASASDLPPTAAPDDSPDEWLPPRFHNPEYRPSRRSGQTGGESPVVLLPTAEGRFAPVSSRIVHVQHAGEMVPLKVLTRQQRIRRRILFNLISALVSLLILGLVFWWLTRASH